VSSGGVTWRGWRACMVVSRGGGVAVFASLLGASGAGDVALLGGVVARDFEGP